MIINLDSLCDSAAHNSFGFVGFGPPTNLYVT